MVYIYKNLIREIDESLHPPKNGSQEKKHEKSPKKGNEKNESPSKAKESSIK